MTYIPRCTIFPYTTLFRSGIKPEDLSKLFCEFTQLEGVEKSRRGAGLGLAICKKTMELLGGSVHVNRDRKSTRLNSSHPSISYAVFCLNKKRGHITDVIID